MNFAGIIYKGKKKENGRSDGEARWESDRNIEVMKGKEERGMEKQSWDCRSSGDGLTISCLLKLKFNLKNKND